MARGEEASRRLQAGSRRDRQREWSRRRTRAVLKAIALYCDFGSTNAKPAFPGAFAEIASNALQPWAIRIPYAT
jgi:hypothetical protein